MTYDQIEADDNFACSIILEESNLNVRCYMLYGTGFTMDFFFFHDNKLLFEGDVYRPPMLFGQASPVSIAQVLRLITKPPGMDDAEERLYYTMEQREWTGTQSCQSLDALVMDFLSYDMDNEEIEKARITATDRFIKGYLNK